uniref:Uncharacterized protein n=1 Tax=Arundo donax TaxID=35708 RepID=A0A0A9HD85_ARUDO
MLNYYVQYHSKTFLMHTLANGENRPSENQLDMMNIFFIGNALN